MNRISETEKLDILLVLASAFENTFFDSNTKTLPEIAARLTDSMPSKEFSSLQARAVFLDQLPVENRELWREICLDKILRRGKSIRLDENINPVHIGNVLSREPESIQKHILKNLPADLSQRIAQYLELSFESENEKTEPIDKEISELIRQTFLANFVSLEDIYEPSELDRLSVIGITNFLHQLGLREIAIACRGISSKETLASFLNSFPPDDTREIVRYLTELENIKPFWVAQADEMVRNNWESDANTEEVIEIIGFKLLAIAYVEREEIARRYTGQKFSSKNSQKWKRILRTTENEFFLNEEAKSRMEMRRKTVEKLAVRFNQTGTF